MGAAAVNRPTGEFASSAQCGRRADKTLARAESDFLVPFFAVLLYDGLCRRKSATGLTLETAIMMFAARLRCSCAVLFTSGACLIGVTGCSDYQTPPPAAVAQATEPDPGKSEAAKEAPQAANSNLTAAEGAPAVTEVAAV